MGQFKKEAKQRFHSDSLLTDVLIPFGIAPLRHFIIMELLIELLCVIYFDNIEVED